jgi:hypothetical protein
MFSVPTLKGYFYTNLGGTLNRRFGYLTRSGNKGYLSFCAWTAWFAATSFREITWYGSGFGYRMKLIASARASLPTKVDGDDLVKYLFFGN